MSTAGDEVAAMFAASENTTPTAWDRWADKVEKLLGHDLDGDEALDGFSVDGALAAFERGQGAADYADVVRSRKEILQNIRGQ